MPIRRAPRPAAGSPVARSLAEVRQRIAQACERAHRDPAIFEPVVQPIITTPPAADRHVSSDDFFVFLIDHSSTAPNFAFFARKGMV